MEVRRAKKRDLKAVKKLADEHRHELGFVRSASLEEAINERRLLVAVDSSPVSRPSFRIIGFVHFRCCKDGHATIYEIAVAPEWRGKGVGKALVNAVVEEAKKRGCTTLRLKCPVDLPANGFYARLGFNRIGIESGKLRQLVIWELPLNSSSPVPRPSSRHWQFFVGLTSDASQVRALVRRFFEGYNFQPPFNPFERVIVSALAEPATLRLLKAWRQGDLSVLKIASPVPRPSSLMFDSGGYQVQMGKISYDELCKRLREIYERETWADFYVLPDNVPTSRDADFEVEQKVKETLAMGELFQRWLEQAWGPNHGKQLIGVVHGRNVQQVVFAVRKWHELGIDYIAFGSFGTSGPNGSVNMLSERALNLLRTLVEEANSNGQKLHIFGIGNPTYLLRLAEQGIVPTSFDSVGWWKAGGFGNLLFSRAPQLHVARHSYSMKLVSLDKVKQVKQFVGHDCPFCSDLELVRQSRWFRVLHNLVAFAETVRELTEDGKAESIPNLNWAHREVRPPT
ncbi:Ribosomal protein S18 acetylase RimI [Candidatus Fervidibacteria bacterium JGI MDM2 JNZ-1-D12]